MVRRALFTSTPPSTPPGAPVKKKKASSRRPSSFSGVNVPLLFKPEEPETPKLEWGVSPVLIEAQFLAESGGVREKYLLHNPEDVSEETDERYLERLWELYFPHDQPRNLFEESYLKLMRDCINSRLADLRK